MRKVLIISYYWPPVGGSGVQRWLKFVKYLPKNNWKPIIYTPDSPYNEIQDKNLLNDIPEEAEVWKQPIFEPYSLKDKLLGKVENTQSSGILSRKKSFKNRLLYWIRGNFFIPDPKVLWVRPSVKFLLDKIKQEDINHIITTGPPHSMHLIGLEIKKAFSDIKWIADFRDPWSELDLLNEFYLTSSSKKKHIKLEKNVLKSANLILTVSEKWQDDFKRLGAKNIALITNGYDADDFNFEDIKKDKFVIGHYGLLNHLRNPINLWNTLDNLCKDNRDFNNKLEIRLSGNIDNNIINYINSLPYLCNKLRVLGYLNHDAVINEYNDSSVLLLLLFNSNSGIGNYPGKLFEYLAARRPILAFGPDNSNVSKLIHKTCSGKYFTYDEVELRKVILGLFNRHYKFEFKEIEQFSRERLTISLSDILNNL